MTIGTAKTGTVGSAGRPKTLPCPWTAKLTVERGAAIAQAVRSRGTLTRKNVAKGTRSGQFQTYPKDIEQLVDSRREEFRRTMMALV